MRKTHFPAKGFTLVELMVTVVVVGILVSVAVPSFNKSREVALARDAQSMKIESSSISTAVDTVTGAPRKRHIQ